MRNNPALNCKANSSSAPYMEHDGPQYLSATDGVFRRPSKGQSLISYLSEQDFGSCADLEKENAHFSISESLIAAIELMKCNVMCRQLQEEEDDSDREICELKRKIRLRRQQIQIRQTLSNYGDRESSSKNRLMRGLWFGDRSAASGQWDVSMAFPCANGVIVKPFSSLVQIE
ncbi:hypothetical protein FKM82_026053 [Ascaphus truei]